MHNFELQNMFKNEDSEDDRKHDTEDEDAADEDENLGQHQSIFSIEEKDFMFNNYTYKQVVAAAGCFFIVTTNNTIIYAEEEKYMGLNFEFFLNCW